MLFHESDRKFWTSQVTMGSYYIKREIKREIEIIYRDIERFREIKNVHRYLTKGHD